MTSKPYHEGEIAVQRAAGDEAAARQTAAMIANVVPAGAASFLSLQRMLVVASRDDRGRPWASILFGDPGFVFPRDRGRVVAVDRSASYSPNDILPWPHLRIGSPLGLLAIDLSTRRRLRVNGVVGSLTDARLDLTVEQAYPNCPKYIQRRRLEEFKPGEDSARSVTRHGRIPDATLAAAVESADTIFVSSGHPTRGLDASHRGGPPGFIKAVAPDVFRVPDYEGNGMFNTLGNLAVDARCGVTVLDFREGRVHQMTGEAALRFEDPPPVDTAPVSGRSWDFHVREWQSTDLPVRMKWAFVDYSPYNPT